MFIMCASHLFNMNIFIYEHIYEAYLYLTYIHKYTYISHFFYIHVCIYIYIQIYIYAYIYIHIYVYIPELTSPCYKDTV